jgi:hypothetical protein
MYNNFITFASQSAALSGLRSEKPSFYRDFILNPQLNGPATIGALPSLTRIGPDLTFGRNTSATFLNQQGFIQTVGVNIPRFEWDNHRTNLLSASEDFTNPAWSGAGQAGFDDLQNVIARGDIAKSAIGPDGVFNSAWTVNVSALSGIYTAAGGFYQFVQPQALLRDQIITASGWFRSTNPTPVYFNANSGGGFGTFFIVDQVWRRYTVTGVWSVPDINRNVGLGWYSFGGVSLNLPASAQLYIYGLQLEPGSTATPYISTGSRPVTVSTPKGLLLEERRINLVTHSTDYNTANWSTNLTRVSAVSATNLTLAPDGTNTATLILETSTTDIHPSPQFSANTTLLSGTNYTVSWFVKPYGRYTGSLIFVAPTDNSLCTATFNLSANTVTSTSQTINNFNPHGQIQTYPNNWYRVGMTFTIPQSTGYTGYYDFRLSPTDSNSANTTYPGNTAVGMFFWGAQWEQGHRNEFNELQRADFMTSYIPTNGLSADRGIEVPWMPVNTSGNNFYNPKEGTQLVSYSPLVSSTSRNRFLNLLHFSGGSTFYGIRIDGNTFPQGHRIAIRDGRGGGDITFTRPLTGAITIGHSYNAQGNSGSLNGDLLTNTNTVTGVRQWTMQPYILGDWINLGINSANGHIRKVGYWPRRLSNTTLRALTNPQIGFAKYFAEDKSLYTGTGPGVEVLRNSQATYIDSDGIIKTASVNKPRFDHGPVTKVCQGLLIEEQRTNIVSWSSRIDTWEPTNLSTNILSPIEAPDGTLTATPFERQIGQTLGARTAPIYDLAGIIKSAGTYTWSMFVKRHNHDFAQIAFVVGAFPNWAIWRVRVDLNTGSFIDGTVIRQNWTNPLTPNIIINNRNMLESENGVNGVYNDVQVVTYPNGWFRVIGTSTFTDNPYLINARLSIQPVQSTGFISPAGPAGVTAWGAQVEEGAFATSYIPTAGNAAGVTRAEDIIQVNSNSFDTFYNESQGTFYAKVLPVSGSQTAAILDIGDINNSIHGIWKSGEGGDGSVGTSWNTFSDTSFLSANALFVPLTSNSVSITGIGNIPSRIAYTYGPGNFITSVSSTLVTQSTAVSALPSLEGFSYFNGHIQSLEYYNVQLPTTQLTALSN